MEILFVSPEVVPFSKVGGLGDVNGSLPKALKALGHKVMVVSLMYGNIDPMTNALARRLVKVQVPLGTETVTAEVYETKLPSGVQVTLLNAPGLTDRPRVYGEPDDHRRFAFLCRGAIEWMRVQPKPPDVLHAHDWTTALLPLLTRIAAASDPRLAAVKTVFTIHNLAYQGIFAPETLTETGVPERYFSPDMLEFYGKVSWLKGGILSADKVTTVSPSYAREISSPEGGVGLDGVLRSRGKDVVGILNGVDYAVWNPATDPNLAARFDAEDPSAKARCKTDLLASTNLPTDPDVPLFGFVGRLDRQKGIELLLQAAPRLVRQNIRLVVLGEGEPALSEGLVDLARRFPDRVSVTIGFNDLLAHKIYAGADFFLAPSLFEPCGLTHLYAMRYGAIPIVRATGGLRDTVLDCDSQLETGTGFLFEEPSAGELYGAIARATSVYGRREATARLRRRVMRKDFSWDRSARQYQAIYTGLTGQ